MTNNKQNTENTAQQDSQVYTIVSPQKIKQILDTIELKQVGWECNEDIMTFNGSPIGMTISRNIEIDRWWWELKIKIADYIYNNLSD